MFTTRYRGMYIHGYTHKEECRVTYASGLEHGTYKSLRAAKCMITRATHKAFGYGNIPKVFQHKGK